jgi:hypothetical protein
MARQRRWAAVKAARRASLSVVASTQSRRRRWTGGERAFAGEGVLEGMVFVVLSTAPSVSCEGKIAFPRKGVRVLAALAPFPGQEGKVSPWTPSLLRREESSRATFALRKGTSHVCFSLDDALGPYRGTAIGQLESLGMYFRHLGAIRSTARNCLAASRLRPRSWSNSPSRRRGYGSFGQARHLAESLLCFAEPACLREDLGQAEDRIGVSWVEPSRLAQLPLGLGEATNSGKSVAKPYACIGIRGIEPETAAVGGNGWRCCSLRLVGFAEPEPRLGILGSQVCRSA